jgi:hypothetical protein
VNVCHNLKGGDREEPDLSGIADVGQQEDEVRPSHGPDDARHEKERYSSWLNL